MSYFTRPRPRVFGHRGAAGLAPENTLPSFTLATQVGAPYLELDVHGTADGEIVVIHDATLDRTTDGSGPVSACTLVQVQRLDAGYRFTPDGSHFPCRGQGIRIPRLADVLRAFPDASFNIEIKQEAPDIVSTVLDLLDLAGALERTLLAAEHDSIMARIRAAAPVHVATGYCVGEVIDFMRRVADADWNGYIPAGRALQIPPAYGGIELVTADSVAAAKRCGVEMHVWTINHRAEMDRLLDLGVDGLMSDLPALAIEAVAARQARGGGTESP